VWHRQKCSSNQHILTSNSCHSQLLNNGACVFVGVACVLHMKNNALSILLVLMYGSYNEQFLQIKKTIIVQ